MDPLPPSGPAAPPTGPASDADPAGALGVAYSGITAAVGDLDDRDLLLPTRCRGWTVADLLLHVVGDAQRALVALATPADGPPDVDRVTYWRGFPGTGDPADAVAHAQWVRRSASAFARPGGVVRVWRDTAPAAVRAAVAADPAAPVGTQGHVLTVADLVATLVTEAVVHHLDLVVELPGAPRPAPGPTAVAVATVRALAGDGGVSGRWDAWTTLLKGTGRLPLDDADRAELGGAAAAYPLLG